MNFANLFKKYSVVKIEKIFLFSVLIVYFFSACTSSEKARKAHDATENVLFNKWVNHPKSQLIKSWGIPDSTMLDGKGGEILIYKEGIDYKSVMNEKYTGPQYSFRKEMYVNADSIIYYWRAWRKR